MHFGVGGWFLLLAVLGIAHTQLKPVQDDSGSDITDHLYERRMMRSGQTLTKFGIAGIPVLNANIVDPDQTSHSAASDLGLHCLPMPLSWTPGINRTSDINGPLEAGNALKGVLSYKLLLNGAKRVKSKNSYEKRYLKQGDYSKAKEDFFSTQPTDVQVIEGGFSGKIGNRYARLIEFGKDRVPVIVMGKIKHYKSADTDNPNLFKKVLIEYTTKQQ